MNEAPLQRRFLSLQYWPSWAGIGMLILVVYLPYRLRLNAGRALGLFGYYLARNRRYIARVTISKCFPELDSASRQQLVRSCFMENGIGLVESASVWVRGASPFTTRHHFKGTEAAISAINSGQGVLILTPHYSSMDFIAAMISLHFPFAMTYRPNSNSLFNAFIQHGRKKYGGTIDRNNTLAIVRELKKGHAVWYAPDQDFARPEHTVFAPFFGNSAATLTAAGRIADMTKARVFCLSHFRDDQKKLHQISLVPLDETYPTGDELVDATTMNRYFEAAIRQSPSQYLWMHKRFKTQPGGKPDSPYIRSRTFCKNITPELYKELVSGSVLESGHEKYIGSDTHPLLANGLYIRLFEGLPGHLRFSRHPALVFDRMAKEIRSRGIKSVTPDNIFKAVHLNITGVTYHPLSGTRLNTLSGNDAELAIIDNLASFLAKAHDAGVLPGTAALSTLVVSSEDCSISDPLNVRLFPASLSFADRAANLVELATFFKPSETNKQILCKRYCEASGLSGKKMFEKELSRNHLCSV